MILKVFPFLLSSMDSILLMRSDPCSSNNCLELNSAPFCSIIFSGFNRRFRVGIPNNTKKLASKISFKERNKMALKYFVDFLLTCIFIFKGPHSRPVARGGAHFLRQKRRKRKIEKKETKKERKKEKRGEN